MSTLMEPKVGHTPGPWTFEDTHAEMGARFKVLAPDDEFVNVVPALVFTKENARLIAAAPELLAALDSVCDTGRLLLDYMDGPRNPENQERNLADAISAARAAIAKAKGGA